MKNLIMITAISTILISFFSCKNEIKSEPIKEVVLADTVDETKTKEEYFLLIKEQIKFIEENGYKVNIHNESVELGVYTSLNVILVGYSSKSEYYESELKSIDIYINQTNKDVYEYLYRKVKVVKSEIHYKSLLKPNEDLVKLLNSRTQ